MHGEEDQATLGHLLLVAAEVAEQEKLEAGYRIVINNGSDGGETVLTFMYMCLVADR